MYFQHEVHHSSYSIAQNKKKGKVGQMGRLVDSARSRSAIETVVQNGYNLSYVDPVCEHFL